ncbi:MAG TPA: hypothetical protein PLS69_13400, partial [Terricaulis sp.]|nr:hypothetical protein [Terricaulis sp.]
MDWLKLAVLLLDLAGDFARWVEREKLKTEAERAALDAARGRIHASIEQAEAARARVRDAVASNPDRLRQPDRHLRDDDTEA